MLEFIPAGELKKWFRIFGHFYSVDLSSGEQLDCRSVLEIIHQNKTPDNVNLISDAIPDAICIMMNPGSSVPLEETSHFVSEKEIGDLKISLVPTKPDTTQYQVMRIMHYCGWEHVRVLNISDLRDPKSGKFVARYQKIEDQTGYIAHSLFADERTNELQKKMNQQPTAPVILAWGVSPDLEPLIERCLNKVSHLSATVGLLKPETSNKYFHPLPTLQSQKLTWVDNMVRQIKSK